MKKISRRDFLKWSVAGVAALQLNVDKIYAALSGDSNAPIIWLMGSGCTGCSVSTLGVSNPTTIDDVLLNTISMKFHNTLMALSGDEAMATLKDAATKYSGQFVLVIEGAVPTGANGNYCIIGNEGGQPLTIQQALLKYGPLAKYVVAAGTCASFGGIPGSVPAETGCSPVKSILTNSLNPVINLPGCPVHPTMIIKALVTLLTTGLPSLDADNTPVDLYTSSVHDYCELNGTPQCLLSKGCRGPDCYNICSTAKWNGKYCPISRMPCYGCAMPGYPMNPLINYATASSPSPSPSSTPSASPTRTPSSTPTRTPTPTRTEEDD